MLTVQYKINPDGKPQNITVNMIGMYWNIFVSIDINSFREKKDKELVDRVVTLIDKVISINRPLSLNPMNSYERRICYLEIEKNSEVTYKTKEVGMLKKITILPKVIDKNLS